MSGTIAGDNTFVAYLSTSASKLGLPIDQGKNWEMSQSFPSVPLLAGINYYLQVVVINYSSANTYGSKITPGDLAAGNPDMLIGSFSINGSGFLFENGTTTLQTDTTDWTASVDPSPIYFGAADSSPWSVPTGTPVGYGTNGTGIWLNVAGGASAGISSTAQYIWAPGTDTGEAFFETEIVDPPTVPEPASWALMLIGLGGVGGVARLGRRRTESRAFG